LDIDPDLKKRAKANRLQQLQIRYFELEMDRIALEANGDTEGTAETVKRMEAVEKAYRAVESLE